MAFLWSGLHLKNNPDRNQDSSGECSTVSTAGGRGTEDGVAAMWQSFRGSHQRQDDHVPSYESKSTVSCGCLQYK